MITLAGGSGRLSQDFSGTLANNPPTMVRPCRSAAPTTVAFSFSNCTVTADGNAGNNAFVLRVTATVLNIIENQAGVTRTNTATLRFDDPAIADRIVPDSNPANDPIVTVVEPSLSLNKVVQRPPAPQTPAAR